VSTDALGDYRLLQRLGEGAAGEVHLAIPTKDKGFAQPGDPIALKVYKREILRQERQLERIKREFTVGSTLSHPNLVRMYEYSIDDDRVPPFLAMEYVDGITLDAWLTMYHPVSGRLLLRIVDALIDGLGHLHENGVTHRDFKPQNIMMASTFEPKIMDFGVVRVTSDTPITPKDKFVGTIRNSSPEMLFGREYDQRTDLYSLGTVIYSLLYGEQVFAEENQFARLIELIKTQPPDLDPSVGNRDEVSAALLKVARALLEKDPSRRPGTASEVKALLEPVRSVVPASEYAEPLHGYVATALTGLEADARDAIAFASSRIAEVSKEYGLYVYQPRKASDPLLHPDVEPTAVYLMDRKRVIAADVVLVVANQASFGVGQELEIASSYGKPIILLRRDGTKLSRMVTGSFANFLDDITYATPEDLGRKLRKSLAGRLEIVRTWKRTSREYPRVELGRRVTTLRKRAGFSSIGDLANAVGVSSRLIAAVESGRYENVGLSLLGHVCRVLGVTVRDLLEPGAEPVPTSRPNGNVQGLESLARRLGWSAQDYLDLRDDFAKQLAASGEPPQITDDQWIARRAALEQRRLKGTASGTGDKAEQPRLL
jgi:transcriptional regulator with XRE-family HTH domain